MAAASMESEQLYLYRGDDHRCVERDVIARPLAFCTAIYLHMYYGKGIECMKEPGEVK